jgi:hypothetical protein
MCGGLAYSLSNDSRLVCCGQAKESIHQSDATPRTLFGEGLTSDRGEETTRTPLPPPGNGYRFRPHTRCNGDRGRFHMPNHSQFDSLWRPRGFSIRCYWHPASKPLKISNPRCDGKMRQKTVCCHLDRGTRDGLGMPPPSLHGKTLSTRRRETETAYSLASFGPSW